MNTKKDKIDPKVYELYDEYCHSNISRRDFLKRAGALSVLGSVSGVVMANALLPNYALAQTISFTDERIKPQYIDYDSPCGNSGKMRGYLVQPKGKEPFPSVLVVAKLIAILQERNAYTPKTHLIFFT